MADIPGLGMGGTDPVLQQIIERTRAGDTRLGKVEEDFRASQEREAQARSAQAEALKPKQDELAAKLKQAPEVPQFQQPAAAPPEFKLNDKEVGETLSLITALAALGGALTRQPLTAALNNFSAGVHGYVQGKRDVFALQLREFDANIRKAHAENDAMSKKYQAARDKFKTDVLGLQNALKLIAAETQSPIDMELAHRGDLVSLEKLHATRDDKINKVLENVTRIRETMAAHAETRRHHQAQEAEIAQHHRALEEKARAARGNPNEQAKLAKEFQQKALDAHRRMLKAYDKASDTERAEVKRRYQSELEALETNFRSRGFEGTLDAGLKSPETGAQPAAQQTAVKAFATPEEADAAAKRGELTPGMRISIGGQTGTWQ